MSRFLANLGKSTIVRTRGALNKLKPTGIFAADIETHAHGGLVGDNPYNPKHGICGVSLCNFEGDAIYVVINDGRYYGGIDIKEFIEIMNEKWMIAGAVAVFHNCKFDLGFLLNKGLDISRVRIHDTYLIRTILRRGVYVSNALKSIVQELFKITVDSQDIIKNWLKENKTEDYGDVPVDLLGPYAIHDVKYTLAVFAHDHDIANILEIHDLYVRNILHLIASEKRGICVNPGEMGGRLDKLKKDLLKKKGDLNELMNGAKISLDDEQKVLAFLHNKNMHPGPRSYYGESQYVLDTEFLASIEHKLPETYLFYARKKKFIEQFSGAQKMNGRQFKDQMNAGYHLNYFPSTFSKGAIANCKTPDFVDNVKLVEPIRNMFIPRKGFKFIAIKAQDLPVQLLAWYCQDQQILDVVGQGGAQTCQEYSNRNALGIPANSLLLRRILEGSGYAVLERRMKIAGITGSSKNANYTMHNEFETSLVGYRKTLENLNNAARDGEIKDRCGRPIIIPNDKQYRSHAILINSSVGSIMSIYMDALCRCLNKVDCYLVLAHERELLFEVEDSNEVAAVVAAKVLKTELTDPAPKFIMRNLRTNNPWSMPVSDAHEVITDTWL